MALLAQVVHTPDAGPPHLTALLDVAFPCNLACEGCERGARPGRPNRAAVAKLAERLVGLLEDSEAGYVSLAVYGGEPLLDVDAIVCAGARVRDGCARLGLAYDAALITNATLLEGASARRLARAGFDTVQVTIPARPRHGARALERDAARLARVTRNAREAQEELDLVVRCEIASSDDLREALDVVRLIEEEGILDPPRPATVVIGPRTSYAAQARALFDAKRARQAGRLTRCP
jgi:sulfatase maturation enzyme AslB (radical SAM superfamily)